MFPTSSPPFEPPWHPSVLVVHTPRLTRSSPTAIKSSYALFRFSCSAAWCHFGPYSPPPRMFACKHRQQSISIQVQDDKFSREVQTVAVFAHLDEDATALEPARADGRGVVRLQRDLKPTVAVCSRTTTQKRR